MTKKAITKKYQRKLPKFINEKQFIQMSSGINQKCATGARNYAMLVIMFRAGLRVSEVADLGLYDINYETGLIFVQDAKGDKERYVPMDGDIVSATKNWLRFRSKSEYFFCTMKGVQLDTRYIREMCYRVSGKAGVYLQDGKERKPVNPHALRHGYATELLKAGFSLVEIQRLMGHEDISTTTIYLHLDLDDLAEKIKNRSSLTGLLV